MPKNEIIFHLGAAGVPTSWTVTSVYGSCLGIANRAAEAWYEKLSSSRPPQYVCKIKNGEAIFSKLWMDKSYLRRQKPIREDYLIQFGTAPFDVPEDIQNILINKLKDDLIDFGYFIPREEWEKLYPGQMLMQNRFDEFNAAYDAFRQSGQSGVMPYEDRWAMMMAPPEDYVPKYTVHELNRHTSVICVGVGTSNPTHVEEPLLHEEAEARCRLYNSGWSKSQIDILMRDEPIS